MRVSGLKPDSAQRIEEGALHLARAVQQIEPSVSFSPCNEDVLRAAESLLPLTPELRHWYLTASPSDIVTIPQLGNPCTLYNLEHLVEYQIGYRWHGLPEGARGERLPDWPSSWITIADIGADPIIADSSIEGPAILKSIHGEGDWHQWAYSLAPTLDSYLESLARWIDVCLLETGASSITNWSEAQMRIWTEEGEYLPDVLQRLKHVLSEVLPEEYVASWS